MASGAEYSSLVFAPLWSQPLRLPFHTCICPSLHWCLLQVSSLAYHLGLPPCFSASTQPPRMWGSQHLHPLPAAAWRSSLQSTLLSSTAPASLTERGLEHGESAKEGPTWAASCRGSGHQARRGRSPQMACEVNTPRGFPRLPAKDLRCGLLCSCRNSRSRDPVQTPRR